MAEISSRKRLGSVHQKLHEMVAHRVIVRMRVHIAPCTVSRQRVLDDLADRAPWPLVISTMRSASSSVLSMGSVANSRRLTELLILDGNAGLCGEDGELLGKGRIWIEGESRLSFAHHVNHFDAG